MDDDLDAMDRDALIAGQIRVVDEERLGVGTADDGLDAVVGEAAFLEHLARDVGAVEAQLPRTIARIVVARAGRGVTRDADAVGHLGESRRPA